MEFFFDLDGTLLDHGRAQKHAALTLAQVSFNFKPEELADIPSRWLKAETKHFARYERGEVDYMEHRRERLREVFPQFCATLPDKALDELYEGYIDAYRSEWHLYPDALPLLEKLAGRPMALITNGESALQRSKIERLAIGHYFPIIIISGEIGEHKPSSRPFLHACEQTRVAPQDVHYVGDSFTNDVVGSTRAGMNAVWLNRHKTPAPHRDIQFSEVGTLSELVLPRIP